MSTNDIAIAGYTTRDAFAALLKDDYGPRWEDHVHENVIIWKLIAKERGKMGGKRTLTAVVDAFPQSAGVGLFEGRALPTPRSVSAFNPELLARDIYMRLRWTGQAERAARAGDKHAWAKPRAVELQLARKQFDLNVARMAYLGYYQILGEVSSWAAEVMTMKGRNTRTSAAADFWNFGCQYLRKNMSVNWTATVNGATRNTATVPDEAYISALSTSDVDAPTATLSSSAVDPDANDMVVPFDSRKGATLDDVNGVPGTGAAEAADFVGLNGLCNLMLDTNIYANVYALARSSYPTLSGARLTNSGTARAFDELYAALLVDNIADNGIGDEPDCFVLNRSVRREVLKDNKESRRFAPVVNEGGYGPKLSFSAGDHLIPYVTDRDCPPGMMFGLRKGTFGYLQNSPMGPIDETGERYVTDKDAHEIVMHMAGNIFCAVPCSNGSLEDISYDVSTVPTP